MTHRFLFYNCFLMPGLQLDVGPRGLAQLGLGLAQIGLLLGQRLARGPGKPLQLSPTLGRLDPGLSGGPTVGIAAASEFKRRATEIGAMVAREYDIAALCEVFTPPTRRLLLDAAHSPGRPLQHAAGPPAGSGLSRVDSGLLTLCVGQGRRLVGHRRAPFSHHGDLLREGDAWATKGMLCCEIDLGPGTLELYSAHMLAGNDLLASERPLLRRRFPRLPHERLVALRLAQLDDLLRFYDQHHDPRNLAMMVGDFNLAATDPLSHDGLVHRMSARGFMDAWALGAGRHPGNRGDTCASSGGGLSSRLERLGPVDERGCLREDLPAPQPTKRLDYIFVQQPDPAHDFALEVGPVRRRVFPRAPGRAGGERYLSDHVGLEVTLTASAGTPRA